MDLEERYPTTLKFQPFVNDDGRVIEEESDYILRIQDGILPNWPAEVLKEWLYRHNTHMEEYSFLGFEKFQFQKETWDITQIPGRDAFKDEGFCDNFQSVDKRAASNPRDWLAHYMMREGTWNSPIILLDNKSDIYRHPNGRKLKSPYHLLEGHRRLSFLNGLIRLEKALKTHPLWIVRIAML
ncbi:MAG: hypothetical protein K8R48_08135 [Alphaproteobacteria bacterium]|nr:hypothetical protein [Alphaproteobacteria bacterium]